MAKKLGKRRKQKMKNQITGTWKLKEFQIESPEGKTSDWGEKVHGLLIYTDNGYMSVSINKELINDPEQSEAENLFDSILFYSGTYQITDNVITHQVTEASNPSRIGREMIRYAELQGTEDSGSPEGNDLRLVTPQESFGRAILVWTRQ
jgi:hypothetical protein